MIASVILAAGQSSRMGHPKMLLPWQGDQNLLAHVIQTFRRAGSDPIVIVTGAEREMIEESLQDQPVLICFNPQYETGEMISSLQAGLAALEGTQARAALLCPGDLPLLRSNTVKQIMETAMREGASIIAPSYEGRRGHPLLMSRELWPQVSQLGPDQTLRDFLAERQDHIRYLLVDDPGVLQDIDTHEDYLRALDG